MLPVLTELGHGPLRREAVLGIIARHGTHENVLSQSRPRDAAFFYRQSSAMIFVGERGGVYLQGKYGREGGRRCFVFLGGVFFQTEIKQIR